MRNRTGGSVKGVEPAGRIGDFRNFWTVFRWSWIWNECNFSWKIVKYCILYEVCMIKTAPHSTLSPQMWCISKNIYILVFTHPDLLVTICKLVESKKILPDLFSTPYLRWSRVIIALKCDRRIFFWSIYIYIYIYRKSVFRFFRSRVLDTLK